MHHNHPGYSPKIRQGSTPRRGGEQPTSKFGGWVCKQTTRTTTSNLDNMTKEEIQERRRAGDEEDYLVQSVLRAVATRHIPQRLASKF